MGRIHDGWKWNPWSKAATEASTVTPGKKPGARVEPLVVPDSSSRPDNAVHAGHGVRRSSAVSVRSGGGPTVRERLDQLLVEKGVRTKFSQEVLRETAALEKAPGIDDPKLDDLTHLDFLTIDNNDSRDLDQAMHIERKPDGGYRVRYALADAGHYIKPGSALYEEAMKRGVTFYLPGFAIPMLPPELSEGVVSLNEKVDRRAVVLTMDLDPAGHVERTEVSRARIHSRAKLAYSGVQEYYDNPASSPISKRPELHQTLDLLAEVGGLRIQSASDRDVVQHNREEVSIGIDPNDPTRFVAEVRTRYQVEKFNEQISLMCNEEAGLILTAPTNNPEILPIYRVHDEPPASRLRDFNRRIRKAVKRLGLDPAVWAWKKNTSLQEYLVGLPEDFDNPDDRAFVDAVRRQAVMVNLGAEFTTEAGAHHGTGARAYVRASSPMRQMVGIDTLQTLWEKTTGEHLPGQVGVDQMVDLANNSQKLAREIDKAVYKMVLDQYFGEDLAKPEAERSKFGATVLGFSKTKVYLRFDDPPLEVKIYRSDFEKACGVSFTPDEEGSAYESSDSSVVPDIVLGSKIEVALTRYDSDSERYEFELAQNQNP